MLEKIKQLWREVWVFIVAAVVAVAYLTGKKRGKDDQKARENKTTVENVSRAARARDSLNNPDTVRRLHDKYRRQ